MSVGLTKISLPDLQQLLRAVEQGHIGCPVSRTAVLSAGLGHLTEDLALLSGLDAAATIAVLSVAVAERLHRTVPLLELVWTGPEAKASTVRDTAVVVRQLFSAAERSVLVAGFAFDHGAEILLPLHAGMRDRGVQTTFFVDLQGRADRPADEEPFAKAAVERFLHKNWPFGDPKPADGWREVVVDDEGRGLGPRRATDGRRIRRWCGAQQVLGGGTNVHLLLRVGS